MIALDVLVGALVDEPPPLAPACWACGCDALERCEPDCVLPPGSDGLCQACVDAMTGSGDA